jgi:hypothetical protein
MSGNVASSSGHGDLLSTGRNRVALASAVLRWNPAQTGHYRSVSQSINWVEAMNPVLWDRLVKNVEVVKTHVALHERT